MNYRAAHYRNNLLMLFRNLRVSTHGHFTVKKVVFRNRLKVIARTCMLREREIKNLILRMTFISSKAPQ